MSMMNNTGQAPFSWSSKVQFVESKSGIKAWLIEDYTVPLVAMEWGFEGGAVQDGPHQAGLMSLISSLLDEGAGPYDANAFHEAMEEKAIEMGFKAGMDYFRGTLKTLVRHVEPAFDLLRLATQEPRFDREAILRMQAHMMADLRHNANDPDDMAGRAWLRLAFPDHPYMHPARGTLESVEGLTKLDLPALYKRIAVRDTLKIAVVGAIDAARLGDLLDLAFGDLPQSNALLRIPLTAVANLGAQEIIDLDVPQSTIQFGLPGLMRKDEDYMAGVLVNHILGGGVFSARLFHEVREKRGLAYYVHSYLSPDKYAPTFTGSTSTKNERAKEALELITSEIVKLGETGPTQEELDKAKKYLIGSYDLSFDTSTKIAHRLLALQLDDFSISYLDERNRELESVTLEHAKRVAARLFADQKLLVTIAGRPEGLV